MKMHLNSAGLALLLALLASFYSAAGWAIPAVSIYGGVSNDPDGSISVTGFGETEGSGCSGPSCQNSRVNAEYFVGDPVAMVNGFTYGPPAYDNTVQAGGQVYIVMPYEVTYTCPPAEPVCVSPPAALGLSADGSVAASGEMRSQASVDTNSTLLSACLGVGVFADQCGPAPTSFDTTVGFLQDSNVIDYVDVSASCGGIPPVSLGIGEGISPGVGGTGSCSATADPIISFAPGFDSTGFSIVFDPPLTSGSPTGGPSPSVPEPGTFLLLGSSLAGLLAIRRRRV